MKEERDFIAKQLDELVLLSPDGASGGNGPIKCHDPDLKTARLEDEVHSFADKISILVTEKQNMQARSQPHTFSFICQLILLLCPSPKIVLRG